MWKSILEDFFKKDSNTGGTRIGLKGKQVGLLALAALGIILMLVGSFSGGKKTKPEQPVQQSEMSGSGQLPPARTQLVMEEEKLAQRLCDLLKEIEGAGKVQVTIRLESSSQSDFAINTTTGEKITEEKDQGGGTRKVVEKNENGQLVMIRNKEAEEMPVVKRESAPKVAGVLVVAEGASKPAVKARLFEAVQVALGVEPQKILVLPAKER